MNLVKNTVTAFVVGVGASLKAVVEQVNVNILICLKALIQQRLGSVIISLVLFSVAFAGCGRDAQGITPESQVANLATMEPTSTIELTVPATRSVTSTRTPESPTATPVPTETATRTPSPTPSPKPTDTATPVPTGTPTPTLEPTPTATATLEETQPPPPPTAVPTEVPPTPEPVSVSPMIAGLIPTLEQISQCDDGVFPRMGNIPKLSHDNGWPFGLVVGKGEGMTITVQEVFDGALTTLSVADAQRFEFRQVTDRSRWPLYDDSNRHVITYNGEHFNTEQFFSSLPIGVHVWVFPEPSINGGKVVWLYCDAVRP